VFLTTTEDSTYSSIHSLRALWLLIFVSTQQRFTNFTAAHIVAKCHAVNSSQKSHPKLFPKDLVICFFKVDKTCVDIFGIPLRFLENLLESENLSGNQLLEGKLFIRKQTKFY